MLFWAFFLLELATRARMRRVGIAAAMRKPGDMNRSFLVARLSLLLAAAPVSLTRLTPYVFAVSAQSKIQSLAGMIRRKAILAAKKP